MHRALPLILVAACAPQAQRAPRPGPAAGVPPAVHCPAPSVWDGHVCVWHYIVTDVRCPQGSAWNGSHCMGQRVVCPAGAKWELGRCIAEVAAVETNDEVHQRPSDVTGTSTDNELFEPRGPSLPSPQPNAVDPFSVR